MEFVFAFSPGQGNSFPELFVYVPQPLCLLWGVGIGEVRCPEGRANWSSSHESVQSWLISKTNHLTFSATLEIIVNTLGCLPLLLQHIFQVRFLYPSNVSLILNLWGRLWWEGKEEEEMQFLWSVADSSNSLAAIITHFICALSEELRKKRKFELLQKQQQQKFWMLNCAVLLLTLKIDSNKTIEVKEKHLQEW